MTSEETITVPRREFEALIERNGLLEDILAARNADDGIRVPHQVAREILRGKSPVRAFRDYKGLTLRQLSETTGIAAGCISEIERGIKPGHAAALTRLASALETTIDVLVNE